MFEEQNTRSLDFAESPKNGNFASLGMTEVSLKCQGPGWAIAGTADWKNHYCDAGAVK